MFFHSKFRFSVLILFFFFLFSTFAMAITLDAEIKEALDFGVLAKNNVDLNNIHKEIKKNGGSIDGKIGKPQLKQSANTIATGDIVTLKVDYLSPGTKVTWGWDHHVFKKVAGSGHSISLMAKTVSLLMAETVSITARSGSWLGTATVTVKKRDWTRIKNKMKIRDLLLAVKKGMKPEMFFRKLADLEYKHPMVQLNRVKTQLLNSGEAEKYLGKSFEQGGTEVEKTLLEYRKELTEKGIKNAISEVYRKGGGTDLGKAFLVNIGKWASQSPEAFTFAGDIDFTFLCSEISTGKALVQAFNSFIRKQTGMTMAQVDTVSTAHGDAIHLVYVGPQGKKYGDDYMMSITRKSGNVIPIDLVKKGELLHTRISGEEAMKKVLRDSLVRKLSKKLNNMHPDQLEVEFERRWEKMRNKTVEPFLSMEMARHLQGDIISQVDVFTAIDIIKKGSKYLKRSQDIFNNDFHDAPPESDLAGMVRQVDSLASDKDRTPADIQRFVAEFFRQNSSYGVLLEMRMESGSLRIMPSQENLKRFLDLCQSAIWTNVELGLSRQIDQLKKYSDDPKKIEENSEALKDLVSKLNAGLEALQHDRLAPPTAVKSKLTQLVDILHKIKGSEGGHRVLTDEELRKTKEMLEASADNPNSLRLIWATTLNHINQNLDAINAVLDVLDDRTLGELRKTGLVEITYKLHPGAKKTRKLGVFELRPLAKINSYLNSTLLGKVGNSTAFKGYNFLNEADAYYEAWASSSSPGEGFSNIATEMLRRHFPGVSAGEALYNGNYARGCAEIVYLFVPPLAVPEAMYGVATELGGRVQAWYWSDQLDYMVDEFYDGAKWEDKAGPDGIVPLKEVQYKGTSYTRSDLVSGKSNFLTNADVDTTLWANLHQTDPFLSLMEELEENPVAGLKLRDHFRQQYEDRWRQTKQSFLKDLITRVEQRHRSEGLSSSDIEKIWNDLADVCKKLKVWDLVKKDISNEADTASLKALAIYFENNDRQKEGLALTETEQSKFNTAILTRLKMYNKILVTRDRIETQVAGWFDNAGLPAPDVWRFRYRLLTGTAFLTGQYVKDRSANRNWGGLPASGYATAQAQLLYIKKMTKPGATLDTPFDKQTLAQLAWEEMWEQALKKMRLLMATRRAFLHDANGQIEKAREKLLASFRLHYNVVIGTELTVNIVVKPDTLRSKSTGVVMLPENQNVTLIAMVTTVKGSERLRYNWAVGKEVIGTKESRSVTFDGKGRAGKEFDVSLVVMDAKNNEAQAKVKIHVTATRKLKVSLKPYPRNIPAGGKVIMSVDKPDKGKLSYSWYEWSGNHWSSQSYSQSRSYTVAATKIGAGGSIRVKVIVSDDKGHQGEAISDTVQVGEAKETKGLRVTLVPERKTIYDDEKIVVQGQCDAWPDSGRLTWYWNGSQQGASQTSYLLSGAGLAGQQVTVSVVVVDSKGRRGESSTKINIMADKNDLKGEGKKGKIKPAPSPALPKDTEKGSGKKESKDNNKSILTTLKITAPRANQETPDTTILVAGEVSGFTEVASMQMIVNGVKYQMKPSSKFSQKMPIVPGKNTLQVSAKLKDGRVIRSQSITIKSTQSKENRYRFTLRWNTARTDIDLWLVGPTGEACSYQGNSSFAELDRDEKEAGYGPENIFISHLTDYGKYKVRVQYFADHNKEDEKTPTTVTGAEVLFFVDNKLTKRWKGTLSSEKQWWDVYTFTYGMDIEINPPSKTSVNIGETLKLTAKVKDESEGLGEMLKGKHIFRWVSDGGVDFSPIDTIKPKTTALFTRPGKVKIRVQVMVKEGDTLKVAGESKDITIDIVGADYKLKLDPPEPMVGQEAVVTVVPDHAIDSKALDFRWEVSGPVIRQGLMEAGNTWKYGVTSKASGLITVVARGRTPFHGDDAGEARLTFTPKLYTVKAVNQGSAYGAMSSRIYDPQLRDFVEAPQGAVTTDQTIRLRATIEGEPLPADVRWKWTVNSGTSLGNDISQEPTVMRHEAGKIIAKVEARNKENVVLGSDEISFSVFEGDRGPRASQMKLKDAQKAWETGDIDRAVTLIDEAQNMNPKDASIKQEYKRMHKNNKSIKSLVRDAEALKNTGKLSKAKIAIDKALRLNKKYRPAIKLHNEIDQLIKQRKEHKLAEQKLIDQILRKAKKLKDAGKLGMAVTVLKNGNNRFPDDKKISKLLNEIKKIQGDARAKLKKGQNKWQNGQLDSAVLTVKEASKIDPSNGRIVKVLHAMQIQKKDLDAKLDKASGLIKNGKLKDAETILSQAAMISDKYKRYKEVSKQLADAKKKAEEKKKQIAKLLKDAKALKDAGKLDEAAVLLTKGAKQFPGSKKIDKMLKEVQKQQKDALSKMAEGQTQWKNGLLGKAILTLKEASKIDPSNKKIAKALKGMQGQKKMVDDALNKADRLIKEKKFDQAKSALVKAGYISKKYPPYIEMVKKLDDAKKKDEEERIAKEDARKKMAEGEVQWKNGALNKAISTLKEASRIDLSNKKIAKVLKDMQGQKKMVDDALSKADRLIKQKKFEQAQNALKKVEYIGNKYKPYIKMVKNMKHEIVEPPQPSKPGDLAYAKSFAGKWNSTYGVMALTVQGLHVSGNYTHDKGRIEAILSEDGKTMKGTWAESPSYKGSRDAGKMYFKLSSDAKKIDGLWSYGDAVPTRKWTATRIIDTQPQTLGVVQPGQKPPKETEGIKQPSKNDSSQSNSITILSATYGANCGMSSGNVTPHIAKACNGKSSCRYTVDYKKIGDPAIGCRKTYSVQYRCGNNPQVLKGSLTAEAGWGDKSILLDCRQHNQPKDDTPPSNISSLVGSWSFGRSKHYGKPVQEHLCNLTLTDEYVKGIGYKIKSCHPNESYWILEGKLLLFVALDGTITTKLSEVRPNYWKGTCVGSAHSAEGIVFYLRKSDEGVNTTKTSGTHNIVSIKNPKVNGVALDYCREWAKNCGKPAADAWCQANGYSGSISYVLKNNTPPTRIISTKKICKSSFCGRIVEIKCRHKVADSTVKDRAKSEAKEKKDALTKAVLAKRIKKIREEAEKKAALAKKIEAIREAAEERTRIQKEKEKKAALAEKIRRIREEAEKKAEKPKTEQVDNIGGVVNGPKKPTTFRFNKSVKLLFLQTYHWNYGRGVTPPGKIGLRHSDGTMYGPWQTRGSLGQGGVLNAYWEVNPNVPLKPGVYTVVDSDPKTWSTNAQEGWKGFVVIRTGPLDYPDEKAEKIKATREAAEERRRIQKEKEKKAALAEKIRKIREEAERNAVEAQKKIKSAEKFMGTLSGSWSGKGTGDWKGWTSNGTFVMNISKEGKISGHYSGDDNGKLGGSVSGLGKLNIKSGGGTAGAGTWGGSIKIDSTGKLSGNGFWSVDGFKGTWSGK